MTRRNIHGWRTAIALIAATLTPAMFAPTAAGQDATAPADTSWDVVYINTERVGYGRSVVREEKRGRLTILTSNVEQHLTIRRFGQELKISVKRQTEETSNGQLLSYSYEMTNPPLQSTKATGKVEGRFLTIDTTVGGRTTTRKIDWDPSVKSPLYEERTLREPPLKPGDTRAFKSFMPEFSKAVDVKINADEYREVKLHDGTVKNLLSVRITQSILPGVPIRAYLDKDGNALRSDTSLLGMKMITYTVPQAVALEEIKGTELDVAVSSLVRVKNPPVGLHGRKSAVYRVTTPGRDASELLPTGKTQAVKKLSNESAEVTVTSLTPPRNIRRSTQLQKRYVADTAFLQTTDIRVRDHARKAAAGSQDPGTIAVRMEQYVYRELKKKNFSTALGSAAEVARNLEGDCTEHACLLAAMLRAENIPSRVVVGLVYADKFGAFGGHMWTEAWLDDAWVPLDATLGRGGIGPGHLRLADSDMADEGPAPVTAFIPLLDVLENIEIEIVSTQR